MGILEKREGNRRTFDSEDVDKISNLYLCGRLAHYKYYNMDQALESALELCERLVVESK